MKKDKAHYIAFLGIMVALLMVVFTLESVVFMGILHITPAFLALPLAVALCLYGDWKEEFVGGTIFGLCSFLLAVIFADLPFINPLVSVIPRVLVGVVAYWVYHFVSFIISKLLASREKKGKLPLSKKSNIMLRETIPAAIGGVFGAITNTVLVLLMLWAFGGDAFSAMFMAAIVLNSPIEMACCAVLVPIYVRTMKVALKRSDKLLFQDKEKNDCLNAVESAECK